MQATTRKRLLLAAGEAETLAHVKLISAKLFEQHEQMEQALKGGNVGALAKAIHESQKSIKSLRYVLTRGDQ